MTKRDNSIIQQLMDETENIDPADGNLEAKLQKIAEAMAAAQGKKPSQRATNSDGPIDPADAFACEGCQ